MRYADLKLCHVSCHIFESVVGFCEMRGEGQGGSLGGLPASLRAGKSHDLLRVMAWRRGGNSMSCAERGKGGTELWRDPAPVGACARMSCLVS